MWFACEPGVDVGWGCVYRSVQNALSATAHDVPPLADLYRARWGEDVRASHRSAVQRWIEPAEARRFFSAPFGFSCATGTILRGGTTECMFRTTAPGDYMFDFTAKDLVSYLERRCAIVLDDGTFASAIVRRGRDAAFIDPHFEKPERFVDDIESVVRRAVGAKSWMALVVFPRHHARPTTKAT